MIDVYPDIDVCFAFLEICFIDLWLYQEEAFSLGSVVFPIFQVSVAHPSRSSGGTAGQEDKGRNHPFGAARCSVSTIRHSQHRVDTRSSMCFGPAMRRNGSCQYSSRSSA